MAMGVKVKVTPVKDVVLLSTDPAGDPAVTYAGDTTREGLERRIAGLRTDGHTGIHITSTSRLGPFALEFDWLVPAEEALEHPDPEAIVPGRRGDDLRVGWATVRLFGREVTRIVVTLPLH
jgi:hypothetical protein